MLRLQEIVELSNDLTLEMRASVAEAHFSDREFLVLIHKSMYDNKVIRHLNQLLNHSALL
jgi:hypothetical protein